MNIDNFLDIFHEKPVAWAIFYKDDGELYKLTFNSEEAERCRKMAYYVMNLYRQVVENSRGQMK